MNFFINYFFLGTIFFMGEIAKSENNISAVDNFLQPSEQLIRKKRYLAFPTGSSFVMTFTLLKAIQVNEPKNWNLDLEFDIIWPIPNEEKLYKKPTKLIKPYHFIRRHKRDFYSNIELALSSQGFPGENCVLRTICEAKLYLNSPGFSLLDDILRIILSHEETGSKLDKYDKAYRKKIDCHINYPCPVSILNLLLNYDPEFFYQ